MQAKARPPERNPDQLRTVGFELDVNRYAEGSCLVFFGHTKVLCTASVEDQVPAWLRGSGKGWITAEYGMLPRATHTRNDREAARGKQSGRTQEIQRLIGRSLRAVTDLSGFGERQIKVDCDVVQADGGTRTAAITGGYVALRLAFQHMLELGTLKCIPLTDQVVAISCGLIGGEARLDLDYEEDSSADADANFVLTGRSGVVEVQATAEKTPFSRSQLESLLILAEKGCDELAEAQRKALEVAS
ncbi:MAG: ribonuclease PH [Rhodospirillales bacterium]|nr:ribonuclease PH [Rhodospirillales bacterium]